MEKQHLSEAEIDAIFLLGPVATAAIAPKDVLVHLLTCEECARRLVNKISPTTETPVPEQVML